MKPWLLRKKAGKGSEVICEHRKGSAAMITPRYFFRTTKDIFVSSSPTGPFYKVGDACKRCLDEIDTLINTGVSNASSMQGRS